MFVSNSSTLILLAKISLLRNFLEDAKKIIIPFEVYEEFIEKEDNFDSKLIKKEIENGKIEVVQTDKNKYEKILLEFRLHKGEAAAYSLFNKEEHKALLTDDGELIKLCKLEKIPFICSMAVIVSMYTKERIDKENALEKMEKLSVIGRYSDEIYNYFKEKVNKNG